MCIFLAGCAASTMPFEPTKKQIVTPQVDSIETYDRMDCYAYYKAEIEKCYIYENCTLLKVSALERQMDKYKLSFCRMRLGKFKL